MGFITEELSLTMLRLKRKDVKEMDDTGLCALHKAVLKNRGHLIQGLLSMGADVEARTADDETPLHLAVLFHKSKAFNALLKAGANVSAGDMHGKTPLHIAAEQGHLEMMKPLIEKGADIEALTAGDATPLMLAVWAGKEKSVEKLIALGADVNRPDPYGRLPIFEALEAEDERVVKALLQANVDLTIKNGDGLSVLEITDNPKILAMIQDKIKKQGIEMPQLAGEQGAPKILRENAINITDQKDETTGYMPAPSPEKAKS